MCDKKGLKVGHFNARSIFHKMDQVSEIFKGTDFHVIAVTETWLKPHQSDRAVVIDDYDLFRNDRKTHGGGVMCYIKKGFKTRVICKSSSNLVEYMFLELILQNTKMLIGIVYNSKSSNNLNKFFKVLSNLSGRYSDIIITGDFNKDVLNLNTKLSLETMFNNVALSIFPSNEPTHFSSTTNTLLDIYVTGAVDKIKFFNQISFPGISDHDFIFISYDIDPTYVEPEPIYYRDYNNIDMAKLWEEAYSLEWTEMYSCTDIDSMTNIFSNNILQLFENNVRLKRVYKNTQTSPWFKPYIKKNHH